MSNRKRPLCTFTLDTELIAGLAHLRRREGTPASETVRRALRAWMVQKDVVLDLADEGAFGVGGLGDPRSSESRNERSLDEGDLHLVLRALRRLRVGRRDDARRKRLVAQLEQEIEELLRSVSAD